MARGGGWTAMTLGSPAKLDLYFSQHLQVDPGLVEAYGRSTSASSRTSTCSWTRSSCSTAPSRPTTSSTSRSSSTCCSCEIAQPKAVSIQTSSAPGTGSERCELEPVLSSKGPGLITPDWVDRIRSEERHR